MGFTARKPGRFEQKALRLIPFGTFLFLAFMLSACGSDEDDPVGDDQSASPNEGETPLPTPPVSPSPPDDDSPLPPSPTPTGDDGTDAPPDSSPAQDETPVASPTPAEDDPSPADVTTPPVTSSPPASPTASPGMPSPSPSPDPGDGGGSPSPVEPSPTPPPDLGEPLALTDVVIVGAGPAGLAAANEVQEAGLDYVLIDMEDDVGGSCRWAGGYMLFDGTAEQEAAGIDDSPEQLLSEWEELTGADPTEMAWVTNWAENMVPEVHDWLADLGVVFELADGDIPDAGSVQRVHRPEGQGQALVDYMAAALDSDSWRLETTVTDLVEENGRVIGVEIVDLAGGESGWIEARRVILAAGGFMRDLDRVLDLRPELAGIDLWFSAAQTSLGFGHDLAERYGAYHLNGKAVSLYAHGGHDYRRPDDREELGAGALDKTMWINREAARFFDESQYRGFIAGEAVAAQPEGIAWAVFDADVAPEVSLTDYMVESTDPSSDSEEPAPNLEDAVVESEFYLKEDSLELLAASMGVDSDAFLAGVEWYNEGADDMADEMGKDPSFIDPVDNPPFYAMRVVPVLAKPFGGIAVDVRGAVLDVDGSPIPGLYAAGELTGMAGGTLVDDGYFIGSLSAVIYSGRIAGRSAADDL